MSTFQADPTNDPTRRARARSVSFLKDHPVGRQKRFLIVTVALLAWATAYTLSLFLFRDHPSIGTILSFFVLPPIVLIPILYGPWVGGSAAVVMVVLFEVSKWIAGFQSPLPPYLTWALRAVTVVTPLAVGAVAMALRRLRRSVRYEQIIQREAHHRIKNNLNLVSSMLALGAAETQSEEARTVLRRAQGQVRAIATIHDSLSQGEEFHLVDLRQHVRRVADALAESVTGDLSVTVEGINAKVSGKLAVTFSIVLHELVSNAIKHGPLDVNPETRITVHPQTTENHLYVSVVHTNHRLPDSFSLSTSAGLGLLLVDSLVQQHDGRLEIRSRHPAAYDLELHES